MNYIVDTHILIWSFVNPEKLSGKFQKAILDTNNTIYFSQFSLWEISIKYGLGKLSLKNMTPEQFYDEIESSFYQCKKIDNNDLISSYRLPIEHKDPFDSAIIWQAIKNGLTLISSDELIGLYEKHGLKLL